VHRYCDLIDVMIYPRLLMWYTELVTPMKPLEAMAQGRLVLASDADGHRELIHSGETGMPFKPDDPEALAEAVRALLRDPGRWPDLKSAARRHVERKRSWKASVARYKGVYAGVMEQPSAR
jgi:glycosyltransferase involved in cell wall biosynthesis